MCDFSGHKLRTALVITASQAGVGLTFYTVNHTHALGRNTNLKHKPPKELDLSFHIWGCTSWQNCHSLGFNFPPDALPAAEWAARELASAQLSRNGGRVPPWCAAVADPAPASSPAVVQAIIRNIPWTRDPHRQALEGRGYYYIWLAHEIRCFEVPSHVCCIQLGGLWKPVLRLST